MSLLKPNRYHAIFTKCEVLHAAVLNSRGHAERHRCLNYTLSLTDPNGKSSGLLDGCVPMDNTQGLYAHIVQFFRQIGWFRTPENFKAKELQGLRVQVDTGILFDRKLGLRPYVIRFHKLAAE